MKTSAMCSLIVAAMGVGIGIGWMLWRGETEPRTPSRISGKLTLPASPVGRRATDPGQDAREQTGAMVSAELEKMKTMSVEEFAARMADVWMRTTADPDDHLQRDLYLSACDADRGIAFYREYKRRKGMRPDENSWLENPFFRIVGYRDGKRFAERLMEECPAGVHEMNGVAHGWAVAAPKEAVDWINSLPEGSPNYAKALEGILWGLAEKSPATALNVYEHLKATDQHYHTANNVSYSTVMNHGMKGLSELVAGVKDEGEKQLLLTTAMPHTASEPPGEFVKWMAGPLESAPYLRQNFNQMASRWTANAPEAAMEWLQQNALSSGQDTALSIVAASLVRNGKGDALAAWLAANPTAPGQAAIVGGKTGARAP